MKVIVYLVILFSCLFSNPVFCQNPGGVSSNLVLWFKADAGTSTTTDNTTVTTWTDQNSSDVSSATGDPTYLSNSTDAFNFNPVIAFDGNDYFTTTGTGLIGAGNAYTKIVVTQVDNILANNNLISAGTSGNHAFWNVTNGYTELYHGSQILTTAPTSITQSEPTIIVGRFRGASGGTLDNILNSNGTEINSNTDNTTFTDGGTIQIGAFNNIVPLNGRMSEAIVYNTELSDAQIDLVESYLAIKYGITKSGDYLSSNSTTVWNNGSGYDNDVAGIGRDDNSALDQQQSLSLNSDAIVTINLGGPFSLDQQFLIWGNDNGELTGTPQGIPSSVEFRLNRTWFAQENGTGGDVGNVSVSFDLAGLYLPGTNSSDFILLTDSDGDFSTGASETVASSFTSNVVTFNAVNLTDDTYFTLATNVSAPWGVAADLTMWLKANTGTSTTIDGGTITLWSDQGANGNDVGNQGDPEFRSNTTDNINFNPVINFDGTDDYMETSNTDLFGGGSAYTKFVVAVSSAGGNLISSSDNTGHALYAPNTVRMYHSGDILTSSTVLNTSSPYTITGRFRGFSGGTMNNILNINGSEEVNNSSTTGYVDGSATVQIGAFDEGAFFTGSIAETIIYTEEITDSQIDRIESYLCVKYGISKSGDYLSSTNNTIWNSGGGYDNDVTGIGRDDRSELDQQRSTSSNSDGIITIDKGGTFSTDLQYLLWGNDGVGLTISRSDLPSTVYYRLARTWNFQENGTGGDVGEVSVSFDVSALSLPGLSSSDFVLLTDTDADFSSGSTETVASTFSSGLVTFSNVNIDDDTYVTLASVATAPGGIAGNLRMWLKADAGVSPSTDGATITSWIDQSPLNATASPNGDPTFVDNTTSNINFNPTIDFDGGDDFFTTDQTGTIGTNSAYTKFVITSLDNFTDSPNLISANSGVSGHAMYFSGSDVPILYNGNNLTSGGNVSSATPTIVAMRYGNGSSTNIINLNGEQSVSSPTSTVDDFDDNGGINIGSFNSAQPLQTADGLISEAIIFNSALSDSEIKQVESYLAVKYGIQLDQTVATDYTDANGNTVWDATTNSTYNTGVIGIGRDDASGLDQRISSYSSGNDAFTFARGDLTTPSSFTEDVSYIIQGNNNGSLTEIMSEIPASGIVTHRIGIEFKFDITNFSETIDFEIDLDNSSGITFNDDMELMIDEDGDGDFTTGYVRRVNAASSDDTEKTVTFNDVIINDGDVITLATQVSTHGPGDVTTNLVLWLKANEGTSTTMNNSTLSNWNDFSPNATTATNAGTPTFLNNDDDNFNGNPVVDFDGTGDYFQTAATGLIGDDNAYTKIIIAKFDNASLGALIGSASTGNHLLDIEGSGRPRANHNGVYILTSSAGVAVSSSEPHILTARFRGVSGGSLDNILKVDGQQGDNNTSTNSFSDTGFETQIGAHQGSLLFDGRIGEAIIYNNELSDAEIARIESYLALKYGITLDQTSATNYLDSDGNVIWNGTTFSGYNNDITGIGRDDFSDLDQRTSISNNSDAVVTITKSDGFSSDLLFLVWGNDNGAIDSEGETDFNAGEGIEGRLARVWRISEPSEVGNVDISFDLSSLSSVVASDLRLLIDQDNDGLFNDETVAGGGIITGATDLGGGLYSFSGIDIDDTERFTLGTINYTQSPLPVEFTSFDAFNENSHVKLIWKTTSELYNDFFTIQKSKDSDSWVNIGQVSSAGNSNSLKEYEYFDKNPHEGKNYYRLKQTDLDGVYSYSSSIVIDIGMKLELSIFPNPALNEVIVQFNDDHQCSISITNLSGRKIELPYKLKSNSTWFDTSSLSNGIYLVHVNTPSQRIVKRVMILR